MSVFKTKKPTKDGRAWQYRISSKNREGKYIAHVSKLYRTKAEAQEAERQFRATAFIYADANATIDDLWNGYFSMKRSELKPQTLIKIENMYKHIKEPIGDKKANQITVVEYEQFKRILLSKGLSTPYLNKIHRLVRSLMDYGAKYYNINNNAVAVAGGFKAPDKIRHEIEFYTLEQYKLFRQQLALHRHAIVWVPFFDTLYYLGLRKGEANALTWEDIDFNAKTIRINKTAYTKLKGIPYSINSPKTASSNRVLPIPTSLLNELSVLKEHYSKYVDYSENWFVFGGFRTLAETTMDKINNETASGAKLPRIRIHGFRHSCASLLINNGANITVVSKYLGHADIQMTLNTYSHFYESKLNEVAKLINEL